MLTMCGERRCLGHRRQAVVVGKAHRIVSTVYGVAVGDLWVKVTWIQGLHRVMSAVRRAHDSWQVRARRFGIRFRKIAYVPRVAGLP